MSKSKVFNHAGDTKYKTQSFPNNFKTKKTVNAKVYQNTKKTYKDIIQTTISGKIGVTPWNGQRHVSPGV